MRIWRPLLALACGAAFVACGDDDDSDTTAPTAAADTTAVADTADIAATTAVADTTAVVETTDVVETTEAVEGFLFTPPEGDYSIVFPAEPTVNEQEIPLPDDTTLPITFYLHEAGGTALGTSAIVYPDGTQTSLQGAVDGAVSNVSGTLVSQEPISLQGRDGAEIVATVGDGQGTYLARFYLDDLELHQIIAVVTGDGSFDDPEVAAFFDSFRFTEDR